MDGLKQDWQKPVPNRVELGPLMIALLVFIPLWLLCAVGFVALLILSEPSRNKLVAILALFVLMVGTGASAGLAFSVYHKALDRRNRKSAPDPFNQVFITPPTKED